MGANCSSRPKKKLDVGMDLWNEIFQTIHKDFCEITGTIKKWVQSSRGFYGKLRLTPTAGRKINPSAAISIGSAIPAFY